MERKKKDIITIHSASETKNPNPFSNIGFFKNINKNSVNLLGTLGKSSTISKALKIKPYEQFIEDELGEKKGNAKERKKMISELIGKYLTNERNIIVAKGAKLDLRKGGEEYWKAPLNLCTENPFTFGSGGTTQVAYDFFIKKYLKPNQLAMQIYADQTYCGCGLIIGWTTQEESTLRDTNAELMAHLIGNGYIEVTKKGKWYPYVFESDDPNFKPLSTSDGYLINGKISFVNLVNIPKPAEVKYLFASMPSLTTEPSSHDVNGAIAWISKYRKANGTLKDTDIKNAKALIERLYELIKTNQLSFPNKKLSNNTMKLLLFSDYEMPEDEEGIDKTIQSIYETAGKTLSEEVEKNYRKTIRRAIKGWIVMTRATGVKYFIGGPIGCGVFGNDPTVVGKIIAEEFIKYGKGMTFVYAAFTGTKDPNMILFQKEFENAFKDKEKVKERDGKEEE
ncbi:MAG: hypothetical protein MJ252_29550 [archaeon]|nr:hypothetical protein [archaeon]